MHKPHQILIGTVLLATLTTVGCGGIALSPVSGKVDNGGSPLKTGTVTFIPDVAKGNEFAGTPSAEIAEDGTYTLFTDGGSGAPTGWYKVTLFAEEPRADGDYSPPKYLVKEDYTSEESTPLSVEVKPGGSYDLVLEK